MVLHICEDILDPGVPDNFNSAYAQSAHITLPKITFQNTQKRAALFTKQVAHRHIENLAVSLASADVKNNIKLKDRVFDTRSPVIVPLETQPTGGKSGRHFYLTWARGDEFATCKWSRPRPFDDLEIAHLPREVTKFLVCYCMPHLPNGKVPCFTLFVDAYGDRFRAHPCYDGKLWNDYAMVEWEGFDFPFPAFIHTFVNLLELPTGRTINIVANGQGKIEAGLYAFIHSFDPVDEGKLNPTFIF